MNSNKYRPKIDSKQTPMGFYNIDIQKYMWLAQA